MKRKDDSCVSGHDQPSDDRHQSMTKNLVGRPQFLSEGDCRDLMQRLHQFSKGGGYTSVTIASAWIGNVRWARNQISTSGEVRSNDIWIRRDINGAAYDENINDTTDVALVAALRRAERLLELRPEQPYSNLSTDALFARIPLGRLPLEPMTSPQLFHEATYQLDADKRSSSAIELARHAATAGMLSSGYIEVAAVGIAILDTLGRTRYESFTQAQYSVTVRDQEGTASGWAGDSGYDWQTIDAAALTKRALNKCLQSKNPVTIEPGRYTTILEPQAVSDFVGALFRDGMGGKFTRESNEGPQLGAFQRSTSTGNSVGYAKLGDRVIDERITIGSDPMSQDSGFPPFYIQGGPEQDEPQNDVFARSVYHPVTWINRGVLMALPYRRSYGIFELGDTTGLPNSGGFYMSGGSTSIDEMITTTKRGLLVTRFDQLIGLNSFSLSYTGFTRDGLWLIENGKISKAVRNLVFTESILFALNNVEQLGEPQRTFVTSSYGVLYENPKPAIVPPLKIKDFSFTALASAI